MGCGASRENRKYLYPRPRQRVHTPYDTQYYRRIQQQNNLKKKKALAEWNQRTSLSIDVMTRENAWLESLLYEPSKEISDSEPYTPWPREASPIDKVMIGKHRSGLVSALIPEPSDTGDGSKKRVKKSKVICYLPGDSTKKKKKKRYRGLEPLNSKSGTSAPSFPKPKTLPSIPKSDRSEDRSSAVPVHTVYAESQVAGHFGAVVRAKATFTDSYSAKGDYPVVCVCKHVQLVVDGDGNIHEKPASYDGLICRIGPDPFRSVYRGQSVMHDLKTIRSADIETMAAVPYEALNDKPPNTKCFPWLGASVMQEDVVKAAASVRSTDKLTTAKERPETKSLVGANAHSPVCPNEHTDDPHLSCVHNLKRYGRVAFETTLVVNFKANYEPLCNLNAVGSTSAVATSFIVSESAASKRDKMGVNLSESDRSCYRTASFKQNTIPRRGLRELRSPDQGLLISDYIQEEDSPKKPTCNPRSTLFVCRSEHLVCLEAVQTVVYDQVYTLTGHGEDREIIATQADNPQSEEVKSDAMNQSIIKRDIGFLPSVVQEEPMIVKTRIIHNVEDIAPSILRGPNPVRRRGQFSVRWRAPGPQGQQVSKPPSQAPIQPFSLPLGQAPSQALSQAPSQQLSQPLNQAPSQQLSQPLNQAPSQPLSQPPSQQLSQPPSQPLTQGPSQPLNQAPSQPLNQAPSQPPSQALSHPFNQAPSHPISQEPSQPLNQAPSQPLGKAPSHPLNQAPSQSLSQVPSQPLGQAPIQAPSQPAT